jgi:hypothetical protein
MIDWIIKDEGDGFINAYSSEVEYKYSIIMAKDLDTHKITGFNIQEILGWYSINTKIGKKKMMYTKAKHLGFIKCKTIKTAIKKADEIINK